MTKIKNIISHKFTKLGADSAPASLNVPRRFPRTLLVSLLCICAVVFAVQSSDDILARATALYRQGRYGDAVLLFRKAEQRGADPFATSFNRGNALFQQGKYPEAAAAYRKAIEFSRGKYAPAIFNYASVLFRIGEYPECIAAYHRALEIDPLNESAWLYLAEASSKTGDKVGTLRAITRAYKLDSNDVSVAYQFAEAYVAMNDVESAVALIRKAYQRNPEETDFLVYIGDIYRVDKKYDQSAGAYREALSAHPDNTAVLYKLADVLSEAGENYVAMDVLSQILQIDPKFSDAAIFLGNLAFDAGWWERAEQAYVKAAAAKNAESVYGLKNLAFEANHRGDKEDALHYLKLALKFFPDDASVQAEILSIEN